MEGREDLFLIIALLFTILFGYYVFKNWFQW